MEYRLGFDAMDALGLPRALDLGEVRFQLVDGPVETQQTTVVQSPGLVPTFRKWMERTQVGTGRPITLFTIATVVPDEFEEAFGHWRSKAQAAAGYLSAILDERLAQAELLEDVVLFDESGEQLGTVDIEHGIRTFEPSHAWFEGMSASLELYADLPRESPTPLACRWYLKAAQAGPTADGFLSLWIAVESLIPSAGGGKSRNQVADVTRAIVAADPTIDPDQMIHPTIGRMAGLRAQVVHQGQENHPLIVEAYYVLESLVRLLIRASTGAEAAWPFFPQQPMFDGPLGRLGRSPRTRWVEPPHQ